MSESHNPAKNLTPKEMEVSQLLRQGYLYKEIAQLQQVKIDTVKKHVKNIYKKLQVRNRMEAVNKMYRA
jgi:NarL family two-component system response regulator LiaR